LPGAKIGEDCNVCDFVFIENDVTIGNRVTIKSGVQLWDGVRIANDVFIGPNVTFTNDKFPRSKVYPATFHTTQINRGVSIGANSTILPGITLGEGCMVGAGSVVTKSVPPFAIVYGNPARIQGYVESLQTSSKIPQKALTKKDHLQILPGAAKIVKIQNASDARGSLSAIDFADFKLFQVSRIFHVFDVPTHHVRGEHAHKTCWQFLYVLNGRVKVLLDDGTNRAELVLSKPTEGLLIPPLVWGVQFQFTKGAVLTVLASESYDPGDYIRNYEEFQDFLKR
jgi:serine acetyltransferase